jgi:hypothetical protein
VEEELTPGEILARAVAYPYPAPLRSFVQLGTRTHDLPIQGPDIGGRRPLLAYGANAAPAVLARKLAALCEFFAVRTAWHGPGDVSPVGHAANVALDLACYNFGIQEETNFRPETREVFPGCPEIRDGYMWANEAPGLGIDINEELAAKYPFPEHRYNGAWEAIRMDDGTVVRP